MEQRQLPGATDVLIVGGGPAGVSAALTCQRLGVRYVLVEANSHLGGQLLWTHSVIEDYLGVHGGVSGRDLFTALVGESPELCVYTRCTVTQLDIRSRRAQLQRADSSHRWLTYRHLILATGARERRLNVPGEHHPGVYHGQFSLSQHAHEFAGLRVVIVGGGDRALEGALTCAEAGATVRVLNRSSRMRASQYFADPARQHASVEVEMETVIDRIIAIERPNLAAPSEPPGSERDSAPLEVQAHRLGTEQLLKWSCDVVVIRIGVEPQTDLVTRALRCSPDGMVTVDSFGRTNCAGVFAVGDLTMPAWACGLQTAIGQAVVAVRCIVHDLSRSTER